MSADGGKHRPLAIFALACIVLLGFGLSIPLGLGPESERTLRGGAVSAAAHDSYRLASPVTLLDKPRLVLEEGTVSLASGSGAGKALYRLLTGGSADLVLDNAILTLHRSNGPMDAASGDEHLDLEALGPIATALAHLDFGGLTLRDATLVIKDESGSETTLDDIDAQVSSDRKASLKATGTLHMRDQKLSFDVALAHPGNAPAMLPIRAAVSGDLISAKFEGRLSTERLQVTSDAAEFSLPKLREAARWLGAEWPQGHAPIALGAKGPMEWSGETIAFQNARFTLDGNSASGSLSLAVGGERPSVEGTLAFDNLSLAPYLREDKTSALAVASDWLAFLHLPGLTSSLVRDLDADLRISASSISVADRSLGRCAASISIKDGKLFADLAEIELEHGGSGDGQFGADLTGAVPRYNIRAALDDFDMGNASGAYLGRPAIEGSGKLSINLTGSGSTGAAILSSLAGKIEIDMPDGARLGLDTSSLEKAALAAPGDNQGWNALPAGTTNVDSLVARLAADNGVLTAQAVQANAGDSVLTAAGTLSAGDRMLDLTLLFSGADRNAAAENPAVKGFRIRGPWNAPAFSVVKSPEKVGLFYEP